MKTITLDARGFYFSVKIIFAVIFVFGVWSFFSSENFFTSKFETANALSSVRAESLSGKYIEVDLTKKKVSLHNSSELLNSFDILGMPDVFSGELNDIFSVEDKKKVETSTITMSSFPNFIEFGGKYALHGIVKNASGENSEIKDNGFIGLSDNDSVLIYDFSEIGMPVYVHGSYKKTDEIKNNKSVIYEYEKKPATSARAYLLADMETGDVLLSKNENEKYPIASITKLFTAITASDMRKKDSEIKAPNYEYYKLGDLYYPLLLRSDNSVANRIATHFGFNSFLKKMNDFVVSNGMESTHFTDVSGLSFKNVSTAKDLYILAKYLFDRERFILDITKENKMTITGVNGVKWDMINQNKLAGDPYFLGGKLGYTDEAEQTALSIFNVPVNGHTHSVCVIVLKSKNWKQDTRTILKWMVENTTH